MKTLSELVVSTFFAILASVVLLYISISSGIGPFVAPVIVLASAALGRLFFWSSENYSQRLALIQVAGANVGLLATAVGFTLPTYFFVDQVNFMSIITQRPVYAVSCISAFVLLWSVIGTFIGNLFSDHFLKDKTLKIPVADLIKTTIEASHEKKEFFKLAQGFGFGTFLCSIRELFLRAVSSGFIRASSLPLIGVSGPAVAHTIAPTLWAVGFIAGPSMAFALFIGLASKHLFFQPVFSLMVSYRVGYELGFEQYLVAVGSGLVLADLVSGAFLNARELFGQFRNAKDLGNASVWFWQTLEHVKSIIQGAHYVWFGLSCGAAVWFLRWFGITSPGLVIFLIAALCVAVYQMTLVSGQIGLVQFGRYATFLMLPALFFFYVSPFQAIVISSIVCIVGAAAANLLFQYRLADDLNISRSTMYNIQLASNVLGAASIGVVFVLLCSHLSLGSPEFLGFRCYARALLIQSFSFDVLSVGIGVAWGIVLKLFGASPAMVLGGILMPRELVAAFALGAGLSVLTSNPRDHMATASGVFAAEAIWIFIQILLKMF